MDAGVAIPLIVRATERLVIVAGGLVLIAIGYLILRRRTGKEAAGEINLQYGQLGALMIKNHGPGFLALALGTALLGFSLFHGTVGFDPTTGVVNRFFSTTDANRTDRAAEITQLRYLESLCAGKSLPPAADCAKLKTSRISLATAYFPAERAEFERSSAETRKSHPLFGE